MHAHCVNTHTQHLQGSIQLVARITAIENGIETIVDDAFVFGATIPPNGVFRRIARLSRKQIAVVGVNVQVRCTNGAETFRLLHSHSSHHQHHCACRDNH